jgi:hypothetical protein
MAQDGDAIGFVPIVARRSRAPPGSANAAAASRSATTASAAR